MVSFSSEVNLKQIITTPTRITDTCESLIDVILVSFPNFVRMSGVINTPISDHLPVYAVLKLKLPKPPPCYISARSFKHYDPVRFTADLASKSDQLISIFSEKDVNSKLTAFDEAFHSILGAHAPIKLIRIRSRPCPYVTADIKDLMSSRDQLHRRFQQTRDVHDWQAYKEAQRTVKLVLKNAEKDHIREEVQAHKDNSGSLWKIINSCIPSKEKDSQVYSKDHDQVANDFNQFFSSVGRNAAESAAQLATDNNISTSTTRPTLPTVTESLPEEMFTFTPVTCTEVQCIILSMPSNKSPGPDKVNMRIIKDCLPVILGPLTDIINSSFAASTFPNSWKVAEIIPLLKDGDHEEASNNRPLSLLVVASKICEKVALLQFSSYLHRNGRLSSHQSGNRKYHSTETLNILVSDFILDAMDHKRLSALVLLDLSKAFDSISHTILLQKLSCVGASIKTVNWFRSYLSGRTQSVRIGLSTSTPLPITHGVPQGAILSPLLFCIYLSDLPSTPQVCHLESYVDDSKIFLSFPIKDVEAAKHNLEEDLRRVAVWCCRNQLLINPKKTKFLVVGTRQLLRRIPDDFTLLFLGKEIVPVSSAKDLGVILDSNLTYDHHISQLSSSCMAKLCQINRVKDSFDVDTLHMIISTLVLSKLYYCSSVWSNTSSVNIKKLQAVQNFACRIITNTKKFDHITPALREIGWLPVKEHLLYKDSIMSFKCMNELAPPYLCELFRKRNTIHSRDTRNKESLHIPLCKTKSGQRRFHYRAVSIWNDMDSDLKKLPLRTFKKKLKMSMIENLFSARAN